METDLTTPDRHSSVESIFPLFSLRSFYLSKATKKKERRHSEDRAGEASPAYSCLWVP